MVARAIEDVEAIAAHISIDSAAYAAAVVKKILTATRNLKRFPFAGRVVPEFDDQSLREQFAYNYRIIYRVQDQTVTIAAVVHGRQLLELEIQP